MNLPKVGNYTVNKSGMIYFRINWLTGVVCLFTTTVYSQQTKFILKKDKEYTEEYYVLKTDAKVKNGTYVKYKTGFNGVSLLETGTYLGGDRIGVWNFYYDLPSNVFGKPRNNKLKESGEYINGRKNGLWITYYLDTAASNVVTKKFGGKNKPDSVNINVTQESFRPKFGGFYDNDGRVGEWAFFDFMGKV
jgi:hypothetical protein